MGPGITVVAGDKATTYMMDDGDYLYSPFLSFPPFFFIVSC